MKKLPRCVLPLLLFFTILQVGRTQRFFAYDTIQARVGPNNALDSIIYRSVFDLDDCGLSDLPSNPVNLGGLFYNSNFAIDGTIIQGSYQVATVTRSDDDLVDNEVIYRNALPRGIPNRRTPYAPETNGIGISADYNNRGCLVGQGVSVIDFWDRYVPLPEPVRYLGDLPDRFRPGGQMMFRESSFYYPSVNDELIQLKVGRDSFWARSLGVLPDTLIYAGFFSMPHSCDSTTSYLLHHNPQGPTQLFTLDLQTLELTPYCEVPRKLIHAALEGENIQPPCNLDLDLNLADAATVHLYDTLGCAGSISLLEEAVSFGSSVVEWDSITLQLSGILDDGLETVTINGSRPNIVVHNRDSTVTLASTGFTWHIEYLTLLRELVYTHAGALPTGGERRIEIRAYHPYYGEYAATVYLYVREQSLQVLADISNPACADSTGTISLSVQNGEAPYQITWQDGNTAFTRNGLLANTYAFEVEDADGCSLRDSIVLSELPALELRISSPRDTICGPSGALLATASGGSGTLNFQWNDGASSASRSGLEAGTYRVEVSDSLGCTISASYELFPADTVFTSIQATACAGDSLFRENTYFTQDTSFQASLLTTVGCDSLVNYEFSFLDTFNTFLPYQICAGESLTVHGLTLHRDTTFQLIETAANGCDSTLQISFTTIASLETELTETICAGDSLFFAGQYRTGGNTYRDTLQSMLSGCDSIVVLALNLHPTTELEIAQSGALCGEGAIQLFTPASFTTYNWSTGSQQPQIEVTEEGVYSLTVTDDEGCRRIAEQSIVESAIVADIELVLPDCQREDGGLFVYGIEGGVAPYAANLNGEVVSSTGVGALVPGSYLFQITDDNGCAFDTTFTISAAAALAVLGFPEEIEIDLGESVALALTPTTSIDQIRWSPVVGLSCTDCLDPVLSPQETSIYRLEITDENGCTWQGEFFIRVKPTPLYIPNAFSPNGDEVNDTLLAYPNSRVISMTIYDRWGAQVFQSNNPARGWDGRINGEIASEGVYLYVVEWLDGANNISLSSGEVTLIR